MAAGPATQVSDVVVPENFTRYIQQFTEEKSRLVQSGVLVRQPLLDNFLAGGGKTINVPSFRDLDNDADRVSTDTPDLLYSTVSDPVRTPPRKVQTSREIAVRLSRNNSWSSMDLAGDLAGDDPMASIVSRVGAYWLRRQQAAFIATWEGVFKMNDAAPAGGSTHQQGDMTNDISAATFEEGVTTLSGEAIINTLALLGDSSFRLAAIMCHSVVMARMRKNNLIDVLTDSNNPAAVDIPVYHGRQVIEDDGMPSPSSGVYDTWLMGFGAGQLGMGSPRVPTEVQRRADAGNGGGQEVLYNRLEWAIHPTGHAYVGSSGDGGPANGTGAGDLNNATSWERRYPERKQIWVARLRTREA